MVVAVSCGAVLVGGGPASGAHNGSTTTTVSIPQNARTDVQKAQADLARLDKATEGMETQEKAAKSELATLEKDMRDGTLPGPSGGMVAASGDEVSAAIAQLFATHAQHYAALAAQASALHDQFVQALQAAAEAYRAAEAATPMP
jgi:septal ring factor EnvC (AmiA/AmiB activator)